MPSALLNQLLGYTFIRYLFTGGTSYLVYLTILLAFRWLAPGLSPTIAFIIAYALSSTYNFLMHHHWTFGTDRRRRETIRTYVFPLTVGFCLGLLYDYVVANSAWSQYRYLMLAIYGGIWPVINFWVLRFLVFPTRRRSAE